MGARFWQGIARLQDCSLGRVAHRASQGCSQDLAAAAHKTWPRKPALETDFGAETACFVGFWPSSVLEFRF